MEHHRTKLIPISRQFFVEDFKTVIDKKNWGRQKVRNGKP
jgi:hypothetical protein